MRRSAPSLPLLLRAALLAAVFAAGCHIASGLSELEVVEGGGGAGGDDRPADVVDAACQELCGIATQIDCANYVCTPELCRRALLGDTHPWCESTVAATAECYRALPAPEAFYCEDGFPTPAMGECSDELFDIIDCAQHWEHPPAAGDCEAACSSIALQQCVPRQECMNLCIANTMPETPCTSAWAGLAKCIADNPEQSWTCGTFLGFQFIQPAGNNHACGPAFDYAIGCGDAMPL